MRLRLASPTSWLGLLLAVFALVVSLWLRPVRWSIVLLALALIASQGARVIELRRRSPQADHLVTVSTGIAMCIVVALMFFSR